MAVKVEVAFDLTASGNFNFLTLDEPVAGQLDNPSFVLGGTLFFDISEFLQSVSISRGKSRLLDKFKAGTTQIVLDNTNREFDPTNTSSPYNGGIVPRRQVKVSIDDDTHFFGVIDDWNLDYQPEGKQLATILASDGFTALNNQSLEGGVQDVELSSVRVEKILDETGVNWPSDRRAIQEGVVTLGADTIEAGENALSYLQLVERSEFGRLFIGKDGNLTFRSRTFAPSTDAVATLTDDGTGIPFQEVAVEFGSELLFNEVNVTSEITGNTSTATDADSIEEYGVITVNQSGLLMNTDEQAENLAEFLVSRFKEPEFRFKSVSVKLDNLSSVNKQTILDLELGEVVRVKFTPNQIGDPIDRVGEIISIKEQINVNEHIVQFGLQQTQLPLILDSELVGKLDEQVLGEANQAWTLGDPILGRLSAGMTLS